LQDALHTRQRLIEHPEIGIAVSKRLRALAFRHFPYSLIYRFPKTPSAFTPSPTSVAGQGIGPGGAERCSLLEAAE
jgi:hypothetical protein